MRRPGLWVANGVPSDPVKMVSWRPGALTAFYDYIGPNRVVQYKAQNPSAPIIIRFQHPMNWQQNPTVSARNLADQVVSKWPDLQALDPYVYFANEMNLHYENGDPNPADQPNFETQQFYQSYADWVRQTAAAIKMRVPEMKLVCPPFAFGHHEDGAPDDEGNPTEGWAGYDYLADTIRTYFNNIITFHAYWGDSGGSHHDWLYDPNLSSWYAFRWRRVLKLFEHRYSIQAQVLIDEAGNFGAHDADFTDQVIYYTNQTLADGRIIALTFFLWEDPTNSPGNLPNSWVQRCLNLNDHVARLAALPDVVVQPSEPTIRLLLPDGTVQVIAVEEYLRGVVPAEVYPSWPAEALKAQAVASRSYAMYAVQHPRHPNADLCTTTHCQVYDPTRITASTDQAVLATKDQLVLYQGQVADTVYSANCGGHTLDNEVGFAVPGHTPPPAVPYLRGVPCINPGPLAGHRVGLCQWGAHDMAVQGSDYVAILTHYYTGVTLSSAPAPQPGTIQGTIFDQANHAVANVRLRLSNPSSNLETTSGSDGAYSFANLPAATYSLKAIDYTAQRDGLVLAAGQVLVVDLTIQVPTPAWTMQVEHKAGLPLVDASMPRAGIVVSVISPSGHVTTVTSGSKPEYGPGGWEVYATETGTYTIKFLDQTFSLPMAGQYTRLTFTESGPGPMGQQGVISGVLRDQAGTPQSGFQINLAGIQVSRTATTAADGTYRFANLPAGAYTLSVGGTSVTQTVQSDGLTSLTVNLTLPPAPSAGWSMQVTRGSGLPLLDGSMPQANIQVTIISPSGFPTTVVSGSKPEYGVGGWEVYARETGTYTIKFLDQTFSLQMAGQYTHVTFTHGVPVETQARLVSAYMPLSQADAWLSLFESDAQTKGLFTLEEQQ
jgi:hypothetical protein